MKLNYKYVLVISLFLSCECVCLSQNLVPNPSFEVNTGYPDQVGDLYKVVDWNNVNMLIGGQHGSPDFFHVNATNPSLQLPTCSWAEVHPHSGLAVVGLCPYLPHLPYLPNFLNFREYISCRLIYSLKLNTFYKISFYITNGTNHLPRYVSNNMGLHLSTSPLFQSYDEPINVIPQIQIDTIIHVDEWYNYVFYIKADQPYEYLTIGNYKNDQNTSFIDTYIRYDDKWQSSYYFFDDISIAEMPDVTTEKSDTICEGESITLFGHGPPEAKWVNTSNSLLSNDSIYTVTPTTTTTYIYTTDYSSDTVTIVVNPKPVTSVSSPVSVNYEDSIQLSFGNNITSILWQPSQGLSCDTCANPYIYGDEDKTYTVTLTNTYGCSYSYTVNVEVNYPHDVFIPSAFSPNDDGVNDVLYARSKYLKSSELIIFNRWGGKVFESTDITKGWDGTQNGKKLDEGVYSYIFTGEIKDGTKISQKGNISLIR